MVLVTVFATGALVLAIFLMQVYKMFRYHGQSGNKPVEFWELKFIAIQTSLERLHDKVDAVLRAP